MYIKGLEPDFIPVDAPVEFLIQEKEEALRELLQVYDINHPSVISLKQELDKLKNL